MQSSLRIWGLLAVIPLLGACQGGGAPTQNSLQEERETKPQLAVENPEPATTPAVDSLPAGVDLPVGPSSSPADVALAFMEAMKRGDQMVTSALLTQVARTETSKSEDLKIQPFGFDEASFEVGEFEVSKEDPGQAQVACTVSEDPSADPEQIVWVMKKERVGWRVAGMALQPEGQSEPLHLDFENPGEMLAAIAHAQESQAAAEAKVMEAARLNESKGDGSQPKKNPSPVKKKVKKDRLATNDGNGLVDDANAVEVARTDDVEAAPNESKKRRKQAIKTDSEVSNQKAVTVDEERLAEKPEKSKKNRLRK